jgi:hypothetical protein
MAINRRRPIGLPKTGECEPLSIVYRNIEELKSNPKNPRQHSEKQIQQIAQSIGAFGFNVPFLVDRKLRLIAGHGRLAASKLLSIRRVPTICLEHLSELQIRAFMIADNRLSENATWDDRLLAEQFKILAEAKLDFDLEATGFEIGEIDVLIDGFTPARAGAEDPADRLPEVQSAVPVTQAGDLWLLARNRLVCGDALDDSTYSRLMDGRCSAAVFTDPICNDVIDGCVTGFNKPCHSCCAMVSGEVSETEFTGYLSKTLSHLVRNSAAGALHYICTDWRHIGELLAAAVRVYAEIENLCVWVQDAGRQGSLYRSQHELVLVFRNGKIRRSKNIHSVLYGRDRTNVWQYPRVNSSSDSTEECNLATIYTANKPVALVADAILDCTSRGEIVLDPFLGVGSTLIAAEQVGRICYGLELNPTCCDVAIRRWQAFTGQTAVHGESGESFRESEERSHGRQT